MEIFLLCCFTFVGTYCLSSGCDLGETLKVGRERLTDLGQIGCGTDANMTNQFIGEMHCRTAA